VGKRKERKPGVTAPTAEEIVRGPGMTPRQRTLTPRRQYQRREAELERAVVDYFSGAGQMVRRQVDCGFAGIADVVTEDAVYELKDWVNRPTLYQALGQVRGYSRYLSQYLRRVLREYIICNGTSLSARKREKFEALHDVTIVVWGDPPCRPHRPAY
jgi:hypothetical protein